MPQVSIRRAGVARGPIELEPLPAYDATERIRVKAQPESVEDAQAEKRELGLQLVSLHARLTDLRTVPHDPAYRERVKVRSLIVQQRLSFLRDWIKHQNIRASVENTTALCGGDLDNPVQLIAALRNIILRERAAGRLQWDDRDGRMADKAVLNAATNYVQMMTREAAEES